MATNKNNFVNTLTSNMGSYWYMGFTDTSDLEDLISAGIKLYDDDQKVQNATIDALSRFTVHVNESVDWLELKLDKLTLADNTQPVVLGSNHTLGDGLTLGAKVNTNKYIAQIDSSIKSVGYILDNPIQPNIVLESGVDFIITDGYIQFNQDITKLGFTEDSIIENGFYTNRLVLWCHKVLKDQNTLYKNFGYVISAVTNESSEGYREIVNAGFDTLIYGSTKLNVNAAVAGLAGIEVIKTDGETVVDIVPTINSLTVITDKHCYVYSPKASATVSIGDKLLAGDIPCNTVSVYEGYDLLQSGVTGIAVEPGNVLYNLTDNLIFVNKDLPVTYTTDSSGFVYATFQIGGRSSDVANFWSWVNNLSKSTGNSIAQALRKTSGIGQPQISQLPATVNPFAFLVNNLLRYNTLIIRIQLDHGVSPNLVNNIATLKRIIPPTVNVIVWYETSITVDTVATPTEALLNLTLNDTINESYPGSITESIDILRIE